MSIRVIIADDEPLARERLRGFIEAAGGVEVIAECRTGLEAVAAIEAHAPDLAFLDIQMPDLDGFGVVREVGAERMPAVVFVTAFDRYAVDAFEADAVDYLLKPYDRQRFTKALERALERCGRQRAGEIDDRLVKLLEVAESRRQRESRLVVRSGSSAVFLRIEDIDWVEAARNYVKVHARGECHTLRETLASIAERLDPERFVRIHRSTIVNADRIRRIVPGAGSESLAELHDGTRLTVSRAYRRGRVRELLG